MARRPGTSRLLGALGGCALGWLAAAALARGASRLHIEMAGAAARGVAGGNRLRPGWRQGGRCQVGLSCARNLCAEEQKDSKTEQKRLF